MKILAAFLAATALILGGSAFAQPGRAKAPAVGIQGIDPVTYFDPGKPTIGASSIYFDFDDVRYQFVSQKNREAFATNPDRYVPQFGGLCAAGLASGHRVEADPRVFKIVDGKLYIFAAIEGRDKLNKDPTLLQKARKAVVELNK